MPCCNPGPVTRRSFLFAFLGLLLSRLTLTGARFTSIEGPDLERLLRWCSFTGPRFAGAA